MSKKESNLKEEKKKVKIASEEKQKEKKVKKVTESKEENKKEKNALEIKKNDNDVTKELVAKEESKTKKMKISNKASDETKKLEIDNKSKTSKTINWTKTARICTVVAIIIVLSLVAYVLNTIILKKNFIKENPIATIEIENYGKVVVELYPEYAPNTVANFIALANNGFYNGKTFHRTIPEFMIQGGDPNGDGTGNAKLSDLGQTSDEEYSIKGEFVINDFTNNTLKHKKGVISMARSDYSAQGSTTMTKKGYDSASCQFFIMSTDNDSLDGKYAAFGQVIEGMDIVEEISNVEVETREQTTANEGEAQLTADKPINPPVITSITVDTKGADFGMPKTEKPFDYYSYMMQQYYGGSTMY